MLHEKKPNHIRTCSSMSLLLILSTQTLLMASGNCLECITCLRTADHPTDCTGLTRPCTPAQVCMTLHMRTLYIMNGLNLHFVRRQCMDSIACGQRGSLSSQSHKTKFSIDCCSTDNCRVAIPMLPPDNTTYNGLLCPASSSMLGDVYEPGQAMKCSGDEDQCFQLRRKIPEESDRTPSKFLHGCSSAQYCTAHKFIWKFDDNELELTLDDVKCHVAPKKSFLPVVNMLRCKQCSGSIHMKCERYAICGPEHDACVTVILKSTRAEGRIFMEMMKRCGFSLECETVGTITSTLMISSRNTSCCYTDNCISPIPDVPYESNKTNGHFCESCYFTDHGSCKDGERVACTGDATRCITSTMKMMRGPESKTIFHRGCADPGLCTNTNFSVTFAQSTLQETRLCSVPGISSFHPPIALFVYFMLLSLFIVM